MCKRKFFFFGLYFFGFFFYYTFSSWSVTFKSYHYLNNTCKLIIICLISIFSTLIYNFLYRVFYYSFYSITRRHTTLHFTLHILPSLQTCMATHECMRGSLNSVVFINVAYYDVTSHARSARQAKLLFTSSTHYNKNLSCNIQEDKYAPTVPSPNILLIYFEIMTISCINHFCIKFIPGFYAFIWEAVYFFVSLPCSYFQFVLTYYFCVSVITHKQIFASNFFSRQFETREIYTLL